jgi:dTDP-glucose 4,6-dehydratase
VKTTVGGPSEIVFKPLPQDDPRVRRPDITRAREVLGWEPKVPFDEGMRRTVGWFRERVARTAPAVAAR